MYEGRVSNCVKHFYEQEFLVRRVETSKEGVGCHLRRGGLPGTLVCRSGSCFPHPDLPHSDEGNVYCFGLPQPVML